jgi:hypothetical protein
MMAKNTSNAVTTEIFETGRGWSGQKKDTIPVEYPVVARVNPAMPIFFSCLSFRIMLAGL